jgi:hypothetical protein
MVRLRFARAFFETTMLPAGLDFTETNGSHLPMHRLRIRPCTEISCARTCTESGNTTTQHLPPRTGQPDRYFVVLRSKTQRASRPANYFSAQLIPPGRFNIQQRRTTMTSIWNISRDSFCILIGCFFSFKTFESWSFPVENNHKQNIYQIILMECLLAAVAPVHHVPISGTVRHNFTTKRWCFW